MSTPLLRCERLAKNFGQVPAVRSVNLDVQPGEILAVIGPSGCGKTTLLRLIAGFERPEGGSIWLGARRLEGADTFVPPERRSIGLVFQELALFPHLTVAENIAFGLRSNAGGRQERVAELLDLVGLPGYQQRYPHELSGGEKQRVALARAVAPQPLILLLDEPFASLDADRRQRLRQEMRAVLKHTGTTAVIVTHDQEEAFYMGDRLAVMLAGEILQVGSPEAVFSQPASRQVAAFLGGTDFLPAEAVPGGYQSELGFLPQGHQLPVGSPVELAVRADDIQLGLSGSANGRVVERFYRGVNVQYRLELGSGQRVSSLQEHTRMLDAGEPVQVMLEPGHDLAVYVEGRLVSRARLGERDQLPGLPISEHSGSQGEERASRSLAPAKLSEASG